MAYGMIQDIMKEVSVNGQNLRDLWTLVCKTRRPLVGAVRHMAADLPRGEPGIDPGDLSHNVLAVHEAFQPTKGNGFFKSDGYVGENDSSAYNVPGDPGTLNFGQYNLTCLRDVLRIMKQWSEKHLSLLDRILT